MNMAARSSNIFLKSFCYIVSVFLYCEFLIYYVVLLQCDWPNLDSRIRVGNDRPVYAMFLADTHLLGRRNGHWFDKLRREWQMHRAFQTAMTLHRPQLVFILGDLFDEGLWCSGEEFNDYVDRFFTLFKVPHETKLYIVAGNHDIGFHYNVSPYLAGRFARKMDGPPVQMVTVRGNHFVLINSMAMEGDGCFLCQNATSAINNITSTLRCMKGTSTRKCDRLSLQERYSRPILLQHFPMYRISDEVCTESDAVPLAERGVKFRERWDCLSRESTEYLVDSLEPRVALGGHTHHACYITHSFGSPGPDLKKMVEYSVPSFSWRNRNNPSFMLGVFTPDQYKISKCFMPKESTVIRLYIISAAAFVAFIVIYLKRKCRLRRTYYKKESYH